MSCAVLRRSACLLRPSSSCHCSSSTLRVANCSPHTHCRFLRPPDQLSSTFRLLSTSHALLASSKSPPRANVLEQPDKFRPPSHPQRIVSRRSAPKQYPGPPLSEEEVQAQKTKRYPHMFPPKGTTMHWFLTNRWIHMWITMGVLSFLAIVTLTQSFIQTSPYGDLIPPFAHFIIHPIASIRETINVIGMHINYTTEQTALKRQQAMLDAQKRRLYRRAHGMEDLEADEQGVDVRGLVPWDDGLTNKERREGGRRDYRTPQQIMMGEAMEGGIGSETNAEVSQQPSGGIEDAEQYAERGHEEEHERPQRRKVKKWLGIW